MDDSISYVNPRRTPAINRITTPDQPITLSSAPTLNQEMSQTSANNGYPFPVFSFTNAPLLHPESSQLSQSMIDPSFATSATHLDQSFTNYSQHTPDPSPQMAKVDRMLQRDASIDLATTRKHTEAEIAIMGVEELRAQLLVSQTHIGLLLKSAENSRTTARHWALQHSMLESDFNNEKDRFEVEKALATREVEVLRQFDSRRGSSQGNQSQNQNSSQDLPSSQTQMTEILDENEKLKTRVKRAKRVILDERAKVVDLEDQVKRLKKRITDNRAHNNMAERALVNAEASNRHHRRPQPPQSQNTQNSQPEDGLAALGEVASQVLAEQRVEEAMYTASPSQPSIQRIPATPKRRSRPSTQPNTPYQQQQQQQTLQQQQHQQPQHQQQQPNHGPNFPGTLMSPLKPHPQPTNKRRRSQDRDSTISASGDEIPFQNQPPYSAKRQRSGISMEEILSTTPKKVTPKKTPGSGGKSRKTSVGGGTPTTARKVAQAPVPGPLPTSRQLDMSAGGGEVWAMLN